MYTSRRSVSGGHGSTSVACADVLTTTLRYIHTNKYLKNKLHYTVETACASTVVARDNTDHSVLTEADAAPTSGAAASQAAHGRAVQGQKRTSCFPGGPGAAHRRSDRRPSQRQIDAAPEISAGNSNNTGGGTAPEQQEPPVSIPENEKRAMAVVKFATARAAHHHVTAVLLGVGQRQDGKVCTVGAVAQGVLLELRSLYPLYYVKKDGVKWRPALSTSAPTAAATPRRFTVVVAVPADARWESPAAAETRSGNEEAAPQATASIETPPVAPPQVPMHVQEAVAATVQYVQTRCMRLHSAPQVEQITFAVIATSSSQDGDSITEPDRSENGGHVAAGLDASGGKDGSARINPLKSYKRYLESLPFVECKGTPPATVAAPPPLPVSSISPAAVGEEDGIEQQQQQQPEDGAAAICVGGSATMAPAPREAPSPVTICVLKASKKNPLLSLDSEPEVALPQIIKQVGALKPEVLVMPKSLVPESLQLALLATSNPHCIVLPF
ncbi:conserved hypothetical protein [Leishmania mexicana MHOM/GT/2001/U1103]|uniref:Uncharacterized protein n=1 Tax=Leishmania mexicana (strain MHOM/GT/2001/U1103) TaxID=929439 RepID=E9ANI5_LEIMU|nr:conserved hypothetical protein [Leishmania mexicana MHOM/GT/2001/U1103]CBZ24494.1 conserved hypothetical protein [Leishmania mexicana MHOM/GT/2001/U1103]